MRRAVQLGLLGLMIVACESNNQQNLDQDFTSKEVAQSAALTEVTPSQRALVQRRRSSILRNTLAKALEVDPNGMCLELGFVPCVDRVHRVSLGGMDAYGNSQYQFPDDINVTTPVSLERVVLSACTMRANLDILNIDNAVIYKDVELSVDGRLVLDDAIDQSIHRLYRRVFTRNATASELHHLKHLYEEIFEAEPIGAARNWMVLACFAALSGIEGAFY